jgi:serine/threonine protein kinase
MEFCEVGTLEELIKTRQRCKSEFSEDRVWKIISQFFIALAVMNDKNVAHCDVKDSNIFIDDKDNIKLGDYGLCKESSPRKLGPMHIGTSFVSFLFVIFTHIN